MAKGISAIIATILILLIAVGISGFSYVFFSQTTETVSTATETQTDVIQTQAGTQARIESVSNGNVYLRNTGILPLSLTALAFYVDNTAVSATGPAVIQPGEVGAYVLNSGQLASLPATAELRVSAGLLEDTFFGAIQAIAGTIISMGSNLAQGSVVVAQGSGIIFQNSGGSPIATMVDAGDFGIGTTNPSARLDVVGTTETTNLQITSVTSCSQALETDASGNVVCGTDQTGGGGGSTAQGWSTTALTVYNNTANVKVGVGTNTPTGQLTIFAPTTTQALVLNNSQGTFVLSPDSLGNAYAGAFTGGKFFALWSAGTERVRIDSAGNVGIGTTAPIAKLDIGGTGLSSTLKLGSAGIITFNTVNYNNYALYGDAAATALNVPAGGTLYFRVNNANKASIDTNGNFNASGAGNFMGLRASGLTSCDTVDTDASGNFVCGFDASGGGGGAPLGWSLGANTVYNDTAGVNIGIGTNAPSNKLTVDSGAAVLALKPGAQDHTYIEYYADTAAPTARSAWTGFGGAGTNDFTIQNQMAGGDIILTPNSNIGIGTTTPASKLTIHDAGNTDAGQRMQIGSTPITDYTIGRNRTTGHLYFTGSQSGFVGYDFFGGPIIASLGTVAAPSYTFTGQTGTGFFWPTPGALGFTTSGAERIRFSATGISGVSGSAGAPGYSFFNDANTGVLNPAANILAFSTSGIERVRIDSAGNLNLNTAGSCIFLPGGGKVCGNTTCTTIYSPNGATITEACN